MPMRYWPPTGGGSEPTYAYDNPANYAVTLSGIRIQQHGRSLRMVESTPQNIDRISRTPVLEGNDNLSLRNLWAAGGPMGVWQRNLDIARLPELQDWWFDDNAISANPSIIYFPGNDQFNDHAQGNGTEYILDPTNWCVQQCPAPGCNWDVGQLDPACQGWYFDHCPNCGWTQRPAVILDGQHRTRGMAITPPPPGAGVGHQNQPIFTSVMCNTDLINANRAAKVFIEVTGTAVDLDPSHKDYLRSKYSLPPFDIATRRRAYDIASGMNDTPNFWQMDTGGNPRLGRVSMLDQITCDMINAAGGNKSLYVYIYQWLTQTVEFSGYGPMIPLAGLGDANITNALDEFVTAANNVWPGLPPTPGPGNLPNWNRNRASYGGLQARQRFRTLIRLFPSITYRIRSNMDPLTAANYQNELAGLAHFDWNSPSTINSYTYADTGIDRTVGTMEFLLNYSAYPANTNPAMVGGVIGQLGPNLNTWLGAPLDPITTGATTCSVATLTFAFTSTMGLNGETIGPAGGAFVYTWPPHAKRSAEVRINNTTSGVVEVLERVSRNPATINFGVGNNLTAPAVGDVLDIDVTFLSQFNNTPQVMSFTITVS